MTVQNGNLVLTAGTVPDDRPMRFFSQIGTLLLAHDLPPVPDVYDLLWRYVRDDDHALSLAIDRAITQGQFGLATVGDLRRAHCGDIEAKQKWPA